MSVRILEVKASKGEDEAVSFLQTPFWQEFKSRHGFTPVSVSYKALIEGEEGEGGGEVSGSVYFMLRRLAMGFSFCYVPMGPCVPSGVSLECYAKFLRVLSFSKKLRALLGSEGHLVFFRYDVPIDTDTLEAQKEAQEKLGTALTRASSNVQPPDTVVLDLKMGADAIMKAMKSKWRYNIRLSVKHGVKIQGFSIDTVSEEALLGALDSFYTIYLITAKRDGIALHEKQYYRDLLFTKSPKNVRVTLYLASHEGEVLSGIIVIFTSSEAVYLYGASSNEKRNLMGAYLLQWQAINDAIKYGAKRYDFYGISPTDDPRHPMHGLYLFKTGFGGKIIHRPGSFDVSVSSFYGAYRLAEKARAFYHKKLVKRLLGR